MLSSGRVRTLKVKCPTWRHVETFYSRKLRKDKTLTLRVPFHADEGTKIKLGLELPEGEVMNIEGTVLDITPGEAGERNGLRIYLHGLDAALLDRLKGLITEHGEAAPAQGAAQAPASARKPAAARPGATGRDAAGSPTASQNAPGRKAASAPGGAGGRAADRAVTSPGQRASSQAGAAPRARAATARSGPVAAETTIVPPAASPEDAPVDEVVEPPFEPSLDNVSEYEREVFGYLEGELTRMRESAAHDVLGVDEDADVVEIRDAYFDLTKRFHPDLFARYRSRTILHMAQELFIHINKAYDRMRDALVQAGRAIVAGPALIPHDGWMAGIDDIQGHGAGEHQDESAGIGGQGAPDGWAGTRAGSAAGDEEVMALIAAGKFEQAREHVAAALHGDPRDRHLRALYYVINGRELLAAGEDTAAATQFEAALAHDRDCRAAHEAIEKLRASGRHSGLHPRTFR